MTTRPRSTWCARAEPRSAPTAISSSATSPARTRASSSPSCARSASSARARSFSSPVVRGLRCRTARRGGRRRVARRRRRLGDGRVPDERERGALVQLRRLHGPRDDDRRARDPPGLGDSDHWSDGRRARVRPARRSLRRARAAPTHAREALAGCSRDRLPGRHRRRVRAHRSPPRSRLGSGDAQPDRAPGDALHLAARRVHRARRAARRRSGRALVLDSEVRRARRCAHLRDHDSGGRERRCRHRLPGLERGRGRLRAACSQPRLHRHRSRRDALHPALALPTPGAPAGTDGTPRASNVPGWTSTDCGPRDGRLRAAPHSPQPASVRRLRRHGHDGGGEAGTDDRLVRVAVAHATARRFRRRAGGGHARASARGGRLRHLAARGRSGVARAALRARRAADRDVAQDLDRRGRQRSPAARGSAGLARVRDRPRG